ncbi:MAG: hypothetical protein JWN70_5260 [Planctomycetaceae bacterium]|nr:hypothetical protein [Planctomycetaceae bacterium]
MITNFDELIAYTTRLGDTMPALYHSVVLKRPGCSLQELERIVTSFPNMPESYLQVAGDIALVGIAIGYFQLAPNSSQGDTLCDKLQDCNRNAGMKGRFQFDSVYQIGTWDADPICVAHQAKRYAPGQIVKYNAGNPNQDAVVLAETYEQFLLLAGNLDMVRDTYADADDPSEGIPEFKTTVENIAPGKDEWMAIADTVLS